jgi:DNA-binding NtrC family response regulator
VAEQAVAAAFPEIVGESAAMAPVFEMILKVADTNSTVLIQGSSGTGKELVASAIHQNSSRANGAFIPVHCGAIPEGLLESELFGHEKGSFTGAIARKEGVFKLADRGTLFLDEVSEMSVPLQVKLLRVLETGSFRRVGGVEDIRVDVRVVAATNRELKELLDNNLFRQDLYYRLNVFPIVLPPLRERVGDIPRLVEHVLGRLRKAGSPASSVSEEAMGLLCAYAWPGNVRELENVIERAVILSSGEEVRAEHLPLELRPEQRPAPPADASELTFREAKGEFEKHYLETLLTKHDGSVATAAKAAGMSRAHFYELIKKYDIDLPRYSKH